MSFRKVSFPFRSFRKFHALSLWFKKTASFAFRFLWSKKQSHLNADRSASFVPYYCTFGLKSTLIWMQIALKTSCSITFGLKKHSHLNANRSASFVPYHFWFKKGTLIWMQTAMRVSCRIIFGLKSTLIWMQTVLQVLCPITFGLKKHPHLSANCSANFVPYHFWFKKALSFECKPLSKLRALSLLV